MYQSLVCTLIENQSSRAGGFLGRAEPLWQVVTEPAAWRPKGPQLHPSGLTLASKCRQGRKRPERCLSPVRWVSSRVLTGCKLFLFVFREGGTVAIQSSFHELALIVKMFVLFTLCYRIQKKKSKCKKITCQLPVKAVNTSNSILLLLFPNVMQGEHIDEMFREAPSLPQFLKHEIFVFLRSQRL